MFRRINKVSNSVVFWQIMFFMMVGVASAFYTNPRIVVRDKHLFLIIDHDMGDEPIITESRAI